MKLNHFHFFWICNLLCLLLCPMRTQAQELAIDSIALNIKNQPLSGMGGKDQL